MHKSWNVEVSVHHIIKLKFDQTQIAQNNSPELLNLFFKHLSHKNGPKHAKAHA